MTTEYTDDTEAMEELEEEFPSLDWLESFVKKKNTKVERHDGDVEVLTTPMIAE